MSKIENTAKRQMMEELVERGATDDFFMSFHQPIVQVQSGLIAVRGSVYRPNDGKEEFRLRSSGTACRFNIEDIISIRKCKDGVPLIVLA